MYNYGPRFWYDLDTGDIVFSAGNVSSNYPYWEQMNVFEWPPLAEKGRNDGNTGVIVYEYDADYSQPGPALKVNLESKEVVFGDWPDPGDVPIPEPEETQVQRLQQQLADQDVRLGDVELMLADVVMGGGD